MASRPSFRVISPPWARTSPGLPASAAAGAPHRRLRRQRREEAAVEGEGVVSALGDDGAVHGHELGAVGEGAFDLHLVHHLGNAVEDVPGAEEAASQVHQVGHRPPVADELEELRRDQRDRLDVVQPDPRGPAVSGRGTRPGAAPACRPRGVSDACRHRFLAPTPARRSGPAGRSGVRCMSSPFTSSRPTRAAPASNTCRRHFCPHLLVVPVERRRGNACRRYSRAHACWSPGRAAPGACRRHSRPTPAGRPRPKRRRRPVVTTSGPTGCRRGARERSRGGPRACRRHPPRSARRGAGYTPRHPPARPR